MSTPDYDDIDLDLDDAFGAAPRRPDAVTVLSRVGKIALALSAVVALVLGGIAFHRANGALNRLETVIQTTHQEGAHTRAHQKEAEPASACFRDAMKAGVPVVVNFANALEKSLPKAPAAQRPVVELFVHLTRHVEVPLAEYVKLTTAHPVAATCPDALHRPRHPRAK